MPGSVAPRVAGWDLLQRNLPGPMLPAGMETAPFPQSLLNITVELYMFGSWTNITSLIYMRDKITITRGRPNEATRVDAARCTLTLNNRNGYLSPRNPLGPYHGAIGRNTPIRVRVDEQIRFTGEIPAWPQRWDTTGSDVWVPIEAAGIMRRLEQGASPLRSALRRYIVTTTPAAYWPLDDGQLATSGAPVVGDNAMVPVVTGVLKFGQGELAAWLEQGILTDSDTSIMGGRVITDPGTGEWAVDAIVRHDDLVGQGVLSVFTYTATDNAERFWEMRTIPSLFQIRLTLITNRSATILSTVTATEITDLKAHHIRVHLVPSASPGDVDYEVYIDGVLKISGTQATYVIAPLTQIRIDAGSGPVIWGHIAVWDDVAGIAPLADAVEAFQGYSGEPAGRRIERLCGEEGVTFTSAGDLDNTALLGPQHVDTFMDILREAAETDKGILYEPRESLGLAYRPRTSLYNQTAKLTLDYTSGGLGSVPEPADDDQATRNKVTVTRRHGSSVTDGLTSGAVSTQEPPDGVGTYDESVTVNTLDDSYLQNQASWRVHLGTIDEPRFPTIHLNLANPAFTGNPSLTELAAALDLGDRLVLTDMPSWFPPDDVSLMVQGTTESFDQFTRDIVFNCSPETPYQVAVYDTDRYDTEGSELTSDIDSTQETFYVTITAGQAWSTTEVSGWDIYVGGEKMRLIFAAGAFPLQSFTVLRSQNGIVKAHQAGTPIRLWKTPIWAL